MKLVELATTIRSKNAGVDHITFDVICRDRANFERVRDSGVLNANAIKFTIRRLRPSGSMGESDLFGAQQYAPLFDVEIP